jgi:hypothetical protein
MSELGSAGLSLTLGGNAKVCEWHESGGSKELAEGEYSDINFRFALEEETPGGMCSLNLYKYHMVDESSGRRFHADIEVALDKADLRRMAAFIEFFLREIKDAE